MVENPTGYDPFTSRRRPRSPRHGAGPDGPDGRAEQQGGRRGREPATGAAQRSADQRLHAGRGGHGRVLLQLQVQQIFVQDSSIAKTSQARARLLATGGLKIYTTLDEEDQNAAASAVNYTLPAYSQNYNPGNLADTEVVVQPGTGDIKAMAEDRPFSSNGGSGSNINYAVDTQYGGSAGVQTGSSAKLFTLITALEQGVPFGFTLHVPGSATITGYTNCQGGPAGYTDGIPGAYQVTNAEGPQSGVHPIDLHRHRSVGQHVLRQPGKEGRAVQRRSRPPRRWGCTARTARRCSRSDGQVASADNFPSFTLGSVNVSPLTMAAAYATVAARGKYCAPVADYPDQHGDRQRAAGRHQPACHQALSSDIADAVNGTVLQGVRPPPARPVQG